MVIMLILFMEHVFNVKKVMQKHAHNLVIKIKTDLWKIIKDFFIPLGQMDKFIVHKYGFQKLHLQSVFKDMLSMILFVLSIVILIAKHAFIFQILLNIHAKNVYH